MARLGEDLFGRTALIRVEPWAVAYQCAGEEAAHCDSGQQAAEPTNDLAELWQYEVSGLIGCSPRAACLD